jgi:hypothetical protein
MAQAVRPLTAKARVGPCGIYGGQCGTVTGFSPRCPVLSSQYHSTMALHSDIQGVSGGIVNILGGCIIDYSE